jgi:hypothetical protein
MARKSNRFVRTTTHGAELKLRAPVFAIIGAERTADGKPVNSETIDVGKFPANIQQSLFDHCWSKFGDKMALPAGTSEAAKFAALRGVRDLLMTGEWAEKREPLTPEQRAAILRERVMAAWISLEPETRNAKKFSDAVAKRVSEQSKLGNKITEDAVVAAFAKNDKIIAARAKLEIDEDEADAAEELVGDLI